MSRTRPRFPIAGSSASFGTYSPIFGAERVRVGVPQRVGQRIAEPHSAGVDKLPMERNLSRSGWREDRGAGLLAQLGLSEY